MAKKKEEKTTAAQEGVKPQEPQTPSADQIPGDGDQNPPTPPEQPEPETVTVTWHVNVKHNDKRYRAGDSAEVMKDEVDELLNKKAILPLEE